MLDYKISYQLLVEEGPDYLIEKMKKHEVVYIDKLE